MSRDAVIVRAVRSPVGRRSGGLSSIHPADLSGQVLRGLVRDTPVDPVVIDDVVWGCVSQVGEQAGDIGRTAVLSAGWPISVPGVTVDRQCGSSQQSVNFAAAGIIAGHYDIAVAGGVESMSRVPMGSPAMGQDQDGEGFRARFGPHPNQGLGAEMMAEAWGLSRKAVDEFSLESHARAAASQDAGDFVNEIVPITLPDGSVVYSDEGIRRGGSLEALAGLKTVFKEDGVVTAGNASQISDGSAALLLMTTEKAAALGMKPLARIHTATVVGSDPIMMLSGPIPATEKALTRSGLSISDIGTFEVNEAFAPVPMAWLKELGADSKHLNPQGGAIALGHPLGGSGARLMTTLVHRMQRDGIRYGLQTMCEGGGQANATILELL